MRKFLLYVLAMIATLCMCFGVGCSFFEKDEIKIVNFENKEYSVAFGETFRAETVATDENGNEYPTEVSVKDSKGTAVELFHKTFTALDKDGYTVYYTANVYGETYKKTDSVKVTPNTAPIITSDGKTTAFILGGSYTLPEILAYDYYDGEIACTIEIYKKSADGDSLCEYSDGVFTPTETGTYYVLATAKNSANKESSKKVEFYVRAQAVDGEWDSFDDTGCVYTVAGNSMVSGLSWKETFEGRNGVLAVDFKVNNSYSGALRIFPKTDDKTQYEGYQYLVVNAYVKGDDGALLNWNFCNPNATSTPMYNITYNAWNTFVFSANGFIKNWDVTFASTGENASNAYMIGAVLKNCTMYLDSVYFANGVEETFTVTETDGAATIAYSGDEEVAYTVLFDGKPVTVENGTFAAEYVGEYTIYPHIVNSNSAVYAGEPIVYNSTDSTGNVLTANKYDEVISLKASEYTLPTVKVTNGGSEVSGYTIQTKTTFKDWKGNVEEKGFDTLKKGVWEFVFTASKAGKKSLYQKICIKTGEYLDGEIFNVTDVDAATRVSMMGVGGTAETVSGSEIGEEYKNEKFLKIPYNLSNQYLMKTAYVNFAPSATTADVNDLTFDKVNVRFYVKANLQEGASLPEASITFLGVKQPLKFNEFNEISVSTAAFMTRYYRLSGVATWADYAFSMWYGVDSFKETFSELTVYMSNVTASVESIPDSLVTLTADNHHLIYNSDLASTKQFLTAAEWQAAGITGDYTGNAVAFDCNSNNGGFRVTFDLSRRQMQEFKERVKTVTMWLAVDDLGDTENYSLLTQGLVSLSGQLVISKGNDNFKKWQKITFTGEEFIEYASGQSWLQLFKVNIPASSAVKRYYIGDITYEKVAIDSDYDNEGKDIKW